MQRAWLGGLVALSLTLTACVPGLNWPRFGQATPGPLQTLQVSAPLPDSALPPQVNIQLGAGELTVRGGAENALLTGTVTFNVADWQPTLTQAENAITLSQPDNQFSLATGNVINRWEVQLANATPMTLNVSSGAGNAQVDVGGLSPLALTVHQGAGDTTVNFSAPNTVTMSNLRLSGGAGNLTMLNLANSRAVTMQLNTGVGDTTLDFSGALQQDTVVVVQAGVGTLRLEVPATTRATVIVNGGLSNVAPTGTWTVNGSLYSTPATSGPLLTINVNLGVGQLELVSK